MRDLLMCFKFIVFVILPMIALILLIAHIIETYVAIATWKAICWFVSVMVLTPIIALWTGWLDIHNKL